MDEESIQQLYAWIDEIVLSRPKRNITRDFSDGVLAGEIVAHFAPGIVELHNYTPANNSQQKRTNWETLNRKVFKKLDFNVPANIVNGIIMCKPGVIEIVLHNLRVKILNYKKAQEQESESEYNELNPEPEPWNNGHQNPYYANMAGMGQYPVQQYQSTQNVPQQVYQPTNTEINQPRHHPPAPLHNNNPHRQIQGRVSLPTSHTTPPPIKHTHSTRTDISTISRNIKRRFSQKSEPQTNGALATIPFEGEQGRKKRSPKKKSRIPGPTQSPAKLAGSERSRSMPNSMTHLDHESRIFIQEREQALLQSQETIQILQSKVSRLEHLLQLKDLRIEDLDMKLKAATGGRPMR